MNEALLVAVGKPQAAHLLDDCSAGFSMPSTTQRLTGRSPSYSSYVLLFQPSFKLSKSCPSSATMSIESIFAATPSSSSSLSVLPSLVQSGSVSRTVSAPAHRTTSPQRHGATSFSRPRHPSSGSLRSYSSSTSAPSFSTSGPPPKRKFIRKGSLMCKKVLICVL